MNVMMQRGSMARQALTLQVPASAEPSFTVPIGSVTD
jgi:hypothetical protein